MNFNVAKRTLDDPTFNQEFGFFYDNRDPASSDDDYINSIPFDVTFLIYWWNQTTNDIWLLTNWSSSPLVWTKFASNQNLLSMIDSLGWDINTARNYSQRTSPDFNTSYTPSLTNDTNVTVSISLTSTLITASTVNFQVDTGSGFVTVSEFSLSGLAATMTQVATVIVPVGASYKLIQSSGTSSIVSIYEISF